MENGLPFTKDKVKPIIAGKQPDGREEIIFNSGPLQSFEIAYLYQKASE